MPDRDRRPRAVMVVKAGESVHHLKYTTNSIAFCNIAGSSTDRWYAVADDELPALRTCPDCERWSAGRSYHLVSRPKTSDRPKAEPPEDDAEDVLDALLSKAMSVEADTADWTFTTPGMGPGILQLYPALASDVCRVLYARLSAAQLAPVPYLTLAKLLYWARQLEEDDDRSLGLHYVREEMLSLLAGHLPPGYSERMTLAEIMRTYGPRTAPETDGAPSGTTTA